MAVDIIMPTYNAESALIIRAIKSVLSQTYSDWNLFVAKDGGNTDLAALQTAFNDPRIHFLEFPHRGKPATLNDTIGQGNSPYIAYLDDDDLWYPNHLEVAIKAMQENNARFIYSDAHEIFVENEDDKYVEKVWSVLGKGVLTDVLLWRISHINAVHERSLLNQAGLYDEGRSFFIDWDMFVRMAMYSKPFHCEVFTCQHWVYPKRESKEGTISGIHAKDPALSEKAFFELVARVFEIIDADDFKKIIHDLKWRDEYLEKTGVEYSELECLKDTVSKQAAEIESLKTDKEDLQKQLVNPNHAGGGQEKQIVDLINAKAEQEKQLVNLINAKKEQEKQLVNLIVAKREQEKQLVDLINAKTEQEKQLVNLINAKEQQEKLLINLLDAKEVQENQLVILKNANEFLVMQKNDLLNSLSWKLTKPVRSLGRLLGLPQPLAIDEIKQKIFIIAPRLPEFDRASGDLRLFRILQILTKKYHVFYYNDGMWERFLKNGDKKYLNTISGLGITVLSSENQLIDTLNKHEFHAVVIEFYHLGLKYYETIRKYCPKVCCIIDTVDVHFLRERMMAETHGDEQLKIASEITRIEELKAYALADCVWVVSDLDKNALIEGEIPQQKINIIPNVHTVVSTMIPLENREKRTLLFIGGFVHQPNIDAVEYFYEKIFPLVKTKVADVTLVIVGDTPPESIRKMVGDDVKVLGFVPDTQPYLDSATVSIAPLRYGAGLKGKVGEALAAGLPLVTTSIGSQGMALVSGRDCFIADTPEDFADSIVKILHDPDLWQLFSNNGHKFMQENFGYDSVKHSLLDFFDKLP